MNKYLVRKALKSAFNELKRSGQLGSQYEIESRVESIMYKLAGEFEDAIKGKKFKNPETGNEVQFGSLPAEEQKKLRSQFESRSKVLDEVSKPETKSKIKDGLKKFVNAEDFSAFGKALKSGDKSGMKKAIPGMLKGVAKVVGTILLGVFLLNSKDKKDLTEEEKEELVDVSKEVSQEVIEEKVSKADEEFDKKEEGKDDEKEDEKEEKKDEVKEGKKKKIEETSAVFRDEIKKYMNKGSEKEKEVFNKILNLQKDYVDKLKKIEEEKESLKGKIDYWESRFELNLRKMTSDDWEDYKEMGEGLKKKYDAVKKEYSYTKSQAEEDLQKMLKKEYGAYRVKYMDLEDNAEHQGGVKEVEEFKKFKDDYKFLSEYLEMKREEGNRENGLGIQVKLGKDRFMESLVEEIQEKIKDKLKKLFNK